MRKGNLLILISLSIIALLVWFSCNPFQAQNNQSTSTFNVLDNSDSVRASGSSAPGYAGEGGTTGGAGGTTVTVTTYSDLASQVTGTDAKIIQISGMIDTSGESDVGIDVGSNKTIIGIGANSGIRGKGFRMGGTGDKAQTNVIFQNLNLRYVTKGSETHGIEFIQNSSNAWVDHCYLTSEYVVTLANEGQKDEVDGAIDIKKGALNITVSYCHFENNFKNMLIGFSDSDSASSATKVTLMNCWFDNCSSRQPSDRFATVHVVNCYFTDSVVGGINARMGAQICAENNYFKNVPDPIVFLDSSSTGYVNSIGNIFDTCTGSTSVASCSYKPTYAYSVIAASAVPTTIPGQVGPK